MAPRPLPPLKIEPRVNQYTERTEGLHLSTIITDIMIGLEPGKYDRKGPDAVKWMNFMAGLLFERVLEQAWLEREAQYRPELIRPGELTVDGIIGTPDAYDTLLCRPEEYKCTKKSCRQEVTDKKFWVYWVQLKAYCYMLKSHGFGVNQGALYVLHINGNYARDDADPESGYVIKGWWDSWEDLELEETWSMLRNHAVARGWLRRGPDGTYVPVKREKTL